MAIIQLFVNILVKRNTSKGVKAKAKGAITLQDALSEYFIRCKIGNTDLRYDARRRRLYWRDVNKQLVCVQFSVPERIRLNVKAPVQGKQLDVVKELTPEEIHQHRMEVEPEEVLRPLLAPTEIHEKAKSRTLAMAYHPDRYSEYDDFFRDLATRRMQELNAALKVLAKHSK